MRLRRPSLFVSLLVATLAVGLAPSAWSDAGTRTGSFTALSYNVAGLPEALSGSDPATNSPLISPLLNAYDLVLLQEDWADHLHDAREAGLVGDEVPPFMYHHLVVGDADHPYRSEPARHPYGVEVRRGASGPTLLSDGLNRLSRFAFGPLTREMWEDCYGDLAYVVGEEVLGASGLDDVLIDAGLGAVNDEVDGGKSDCAAQKGFSMARTELAPGVTVDVYNLHADAGGGERDQEARVDNYAQLAAFVNEHSAGRAIILGGDTNLKIDNPDRKLDAEVWSDFLATTGLVDVCQALTCHDDDISIDKFAFRSAKGLEVIPQTHSFERDTFVDGDGEPLSDHDPLAVRFRWVA
ncbi:MAG TPA: hypothetical protein VMN58_02320, partial [Acidimicrobiales bacterium]|nr:hypothetical protein [Acidimicrobiales bacterium]